MLPELLLVALDFYRAPLRYARLMDPAHQLPTGFERLLGEMGAGLLPPNLARIADRLQRSPEEIESAARFFIRQVLLAPAGDHYRALGVSGDASTETVRQHYHLLVRLFHPDRSAVAEGIEGSEAARLNAAYRTLRDPEQRRDYDAQLAKDGGGVVAGPALALNEVLRPAGGMAWWYPQEVRRQRWQTLARKVVPAVLLALALVGIVFAFIRWPEPSGLRMQGELSLYAPPAPAYLRGDASEIGEQETRSAQADDGTVSGEPGATTPERSESVPPAPGSGDGPVEAAHSSKSERTGDAPAVMESKAPAVAPSGLVSGEASGEAGRDATRRAAREFTPEDASDGRRTSSARASLQPPARDEVASPASGGRSSQAATTDPAGEEESSASQANGRDEQRLREEHRQGDPSPAAENAQPARRNGPLSVVERFITTYEQGDLDAFVGLFSTHARVNEGRGQRLIRSLYGDFFRRVPDRRLAIGALRWQGKGPRSMTGEGPVYVSTKARGARRWEHGAGTIRFELVASGDGYRIAQMLYWLRSE